MSLATLTLFGAIEGDSAFEVREALQNGADCNAKDGWGRTPLHWAAENSNNPVEYPKSYTAQIITALLSAGADINAFDKGGQTPLHRAVFTNHLHAVTIFLANGADMNARDYAGTTPLSLAKSMSNSSDLVKIFEEAVVAREKKEREIVQKQNDRKERFEKNLSFLDRNFPRRRQQ